MHEISQAITREKLSQAIRTDARVLVTADPGCLMQMRANQAQTDQLQVVHLAEILEELAA